MSHFERAFEIVVGMEGGFVNDPHDPGGRTIYGITERDHPDLWAGGIPTIAAAQQRYREQYWALVHGDDLPWPLALFVFDAAVNQGVLPAIKMLQRALQTTQDGIIGRQTLMLAKNSKPWHAAAFMAYRAMRYQGTRNFDRYGDGWYTRLFEVAMKGATP